MRQAVNVNVSCHKRLQRAAELTVAAAAHKLWQLQKFKQLNYLLSFLWLFNMLYAARILCNQKN